MEEIVGFCGYRCDLCQFHNKNLKTQKDKERVSQDFKRIFEHDVKPEDIECVGCKNEGKQGDAGCLVRPCALEKGIENCAHCSEFICDKLKEKINVTEEFLRDNKKPLSDKDFQLYIKPYQSKEGMLKINKELNKGSDL